MKKLRRLLAASAALALILALGAGAHAETGEQSKYLTVLFTHDTHDHFLPDAAGLGGYTRLATLLKEQRETPADMGGEKRLCPTVTLDAGDFSMGSLFQTVYATDAPELRALGRMGYDVTTFGNHEFDYRAQGLADMLDRAREIQEAAFRAMISSHSDVWIDHEVRYGPGTLSLPAIVQANYKTPKDPEDPGSKALAEAMERYPVTDYTVLRAMEPMEEPVGGDAGAVVAVFGLMGVDSDECAPMSGMTLEPVAEAAKRVVAQIRAEVDPDFIICLSHTGTEGGKGEDYELAKAVDGIDLIVSGHTHTTLDTPITVNGTLIVSCGPYTRNLGRITLVRDPSGKVRAPEYELIAVDDTVPEDPGMVELAEHFKTRIDETYLSQYGLGYDQVLAQAEEDFTIAQTGDLIGQAYLHTVRDLEGEAYDPIAFAVAPDGVIRGSVKAGAVTTSHAFDILSLGSGADGSPGYPLVSVYLTGKDLKNAFEVDASVSRLMPAAELFGAGPLWCYNPHRMFLDRVFLSKVSMDATVPSPSYETIDDDRLYRVVADLYSGQMLSTVKSKSMGLLSITPRSADGSEVTDLEACVLRDGEGREIKAWYALAHYLEDLEGPIPQPQITKQAFPSRAPWDLLWPMGAPTAVMLAAVVLVILLAVFLGRRIYRRLKKRKEAAQAEQRARAERKARWDSPEGAEDPAPDLDKLLGTEEPPPEEK